MEAMEVMAVTVGMVTTDMVTTDMVTMDMVTMVITKHLFLLSIESKNRSRTSSAAKCVWHINIFIDTFAQ
jgi:hypothetical protein